MSNNDMLINVSEGEECRIALLEDGRLEELYMERASSTSHVGNIYKGRVTNVEQSIQAAFIDFGLGRNGFLHISDLMPTYFGRHGEDIRESVGRKMSRRDRPPIQRCLRRGDEIVVQIIKEGIGTKGPTLNTYLSIPGRILVMMPGMAKMGVSRKIEDEQERRRLRQILDSLKPPKDVGFIIRTAGIGKSKAEIQRDLMYLTRLWMNLVKKRDSGPGPMELYTEGDLVTRTVRDAIGGDVDRIIIDSPEVADRVKDVLKLANPRARNKVELYQEPVPLFHKFGIEAEIEQMYSRYVPLPSGGSLVIDSTEAVVAIDVNSGKSREHADAETMAYKTDLEAADEIPRQLRLRDLGGVIICDFIDLRYERHQRDLERRLHDNLQKDRAKTKVLRMSQFGIIEMTRQRMRPSLKRSIYSDCPHCRGAGLVKTPESMGLDVMRRLRIAANDARVTRIELRIAPDVSFFLQNRKRWPIAQLEEQTGKAIIMRADAALGLDELKLELFDARDGLVYLEELGMTPPVPAGGPDMRGQDGRGQGRGRFDQRRGLPVRQPPRGPVRPPPPRQEYRDAEPEHDHEMEDMEDEVDRREEGDHESERDVRRQEPQGRGDDRDRDGDRDREPARSESGGSDEFDADERTDGERRMDAPGPGGGGFGGQGGEPGGGEQGERSGRRRRRGRRGRGRGRGQFGNDIVRAPAADSQSRPPERTESPEADREFPGDAVDEDSVELVDDGPEDIGPAPMEIESSGEPVSSGDDRREPALAHRDAGLDQPESESDRDEATALEAEDVDFSGGNVKAPEPAPELDVEGNTLDAPRAKPVRGHSKRGPKAGGAAGGVANEATAPRKRTRGGRGRGRGGAKKDAQTGESTESAPAKPSARSRADDKPKEHAKPEPVAEKPPAEPRASVAEKHTPTGSADRHLAGDEPIAPQPVVRPRSYRDLDAIPDDDY